LNQPHPTPVTPSLHGDSVGHYEGDTLVIDTIGARTDQPYAMIDLFGTPYTKSLHVVERYRLGDYDEVKDAIERKPKRELAARRRCVQRCLHGAVDRNPDLRAGAKRPTAGRCLCRKYPILPPKECRGSNCGQAGFLKTLLRQIRVINSRQIMSASAAAFSDSRHECPRRLRQPGAHSLSAPGGTKGAPELTARLRGALARRCGI
jgi:hypothetical protein